MAAALLHDIGHLLSGLGSTPSAQGHNDRHEAIAVDALSHLFAPDVIEPIRLHVAAKRRLCMDALYLRALLRIPCAVWLCRAVLFRRKKRRHLMPLNMPSQQCSFDAGMMLPSAQASLLAALTNIGGPWWKQR